MNKPENELYMRIDREISSIYGDVEVMTPGPCITKNYLISYAYNKINFMILSSLPANSESQLMMTIAFDEPLTSIAINNDNSLLAASSPDQVEIIKVSIDSATHDAYRKWKHGHKAYICQIEFSINSLIVATGASDGSLRIWNIQKSDCVFSKVPSASCVTLLRFIQFHQVSVVACADSTLSLYVTDCENDKKIVKQILNANETNAHSSQIVDIAVIKNQIITVGLDSLFCLWNLNKNDTNIYSLDFVCRVSVTISNCIARILAISHDCQFTSISRDGFCQHWILKDDRKFVANGKPIKLQYGECHKESDIFISRESDQFALYSVDGIIDFYNSNNLQYKQSILINTVHSDLKVIHYKEGQFLVQAGNSLINLLSNSNICERTEFISNVGCVSSSLADDGGQFLVASTELKHTGENIIIYKYEDSLRYCPVYQLKVESKINALHTFTKQNKIFVVAGHKCGSFTVWNPCEDSKFIRSPPGKGYSTISHVKWLRNNIIAMCSNEDKVANAAPVIFNVKSDKFTKLHVHKQLLKAVDIQTKGTEIFTIAYSDGTVHIYDSCFGKCIQTIESNSKLSAITFGAGNDLLIATYSGLISRYSYETCALIGTWQIETKIDKNNPSPGILAIDLIDSMINNEDIIYAIVSQLGLHCVRDSTKKILLEKASHKSQLIMRQQLISNLLRQNDKNTEALKVCLQGDHSWTALTILEEMSPQTINDIISTLTLEECQRLSQWIVDWCCFAGQRGYTAQILLNSMLNHIHPKDISMCFTNRQMFALLAYCRRRKNQFQNLRRNVDFLSVFCEH
ncbi:hypothetical protein GJ496_002274 [Pomphorhynchus laevis]|nr:hypothetical protein GJ496_002274 [Pomphorhynchus laevis]